MLYIGILSSFNFFFFNPLIITLNQNNGFNFFNVLVCTIRSQHQMRYSNSFMVHAYFHAFFPPLFFSNCPWFFFCCTECALNASFSVNTPFIKAVTLLSRRICIHCINCANFCRLFHCKKS